MIHPEHRKCILIVDDDMMHRVLIAESLGEDEYELIEATHGREALDLLQSRVPDLVLTDVDMPVMDGLAACRLIRAQPSTADVPIMVITGMDDPQSVQQAFDAGATDFVTKPLNWFLLRQRVRYILRAHEAKLKLRQSEKRLSEAQRIALLGSWELDFTSGELHWSDEVFRIFDIDPSRFGASYESFLGLVHPDDRDAVDAAYKAAVETRSAYDFTHRLLMPDGRIKHVHERGETEYAENGAPLRSIGTVQDISKQIETEQSLRHSQAQLSQAQAVAHVGSWSMDLQSGKVIWSDEEYRLLGYPVGAVEATIDAFMRAVHPDDLAHVQAALQRALDPRHGGSYEVEYRIVRPHDTIHVEERGEVSFNEHDHPILMFGITLDITERKRNEGRLQHLFQSSAVSIWEEDVYDMREALLALRDQQGISDMRAYLRGHPDVVQSLMAMIQVLEVNEETLRLFGAPDFSALKAGLPKIMAASSQEAIDGMVAIVEGHDRFETESVHHRLDGQPIHVMVTYNLPKDPEGYRRLIINIHDITKRKQDEEKLRQAARVFESTSEAILLTDAEGVILAANAAFTKITGYTEQEVRGQPTSLLQPGLQDEALYQRLRSSLNDTGQWRGEIINQRKNGEHFPAWVTISAIRDSNGATTNYVSVFSDITEIKRAEEKLAFLAHHDTLTGLPNRFHLKEQLSHAVTRARRFNQRLAVLFIDLDGFKLVNDSLGHAFGDQILQLVTERLRNTSRKDDLLARLGGDEFTLVIEDLHDTSHAATLAQKINQVLEPPFVLEGQDLFIGASIGISVFPDDGNSVEELLRNADAAMYQAKEQGKGRYSFYSRDLTDDSFRRLTLETDLRKAIANDELMLVYQPKVDSHTGRLVGAEALIRWNHPTRGPMSPADFIPLAEKSGLIVQMTNWVLEEVCRQVRAWMDWGLPVVPVAVNISGVHIQNSDLVTAVKKAMATHGIPPRLLELEVTEDSIDFRQSQRDPRAVLEQLDTMGIKIALDDFGTGYSSLSQLKALPISTLKIDKSFIRDITEDVSDEAIVKALLVMAHTLDFEVVAEGVETEAQADFLRQHDCDVSQGYLYSRPLSAKHFESLFLAETQLAGQ